MADDNRVSARRLAFIIFKSDARGQTSHLAPPPPPPRRVFHSTRPPPRPARSHESLTAAAAALA